MAAAEWDQILEVFHAARDKVGVERITLLNRACGEGTPLRMAVEQLLKDDEAADGFLSEPALRMLGEEIGESSIAAGQRFGRYVIRERLGRGGMGEVWSARDTELDRPVALKFLSSRALAFLDADQINREAKAASALNHPNIVTIHEIVRSGPTMAIVMELVEGASLRQVIGKPLASGELRQIGLQIARALAAAHGGHIVHGDIKPENISLRRDRYVKVLDFGLARKIDTEAMLDAASPGLGTLRYLSPEQVQGETPTPAADIFSFGLVLYELATGTHAFPAPSQVGAAHAILTKRPRPPSAMNPSIPRQIDQLIQAMLAREPFARPRAEQVAAILEKPEVTDSRSQAWKWALAALTLASVCSGIWWRQHGYDRSTFRQVTTLVPENRATAAAISPDGKSAVYANVDGIFLRRMQTGATKALSTPANFIADRLAWFTDNHRLVASGFSSATNIPSVWLISDSGAVPRLLRNWATNASPSPDGKRIVCISPDKSQVFVMGADANDARIVLANSAERFEVALWSPDGRKLIVSRHHHTERTDSLYYESVDLATGKILVSLRDFRMRSASALADGRLVFLDWDNLSFLTSHQIWEAKTDLKTGALTQKPRKIADVPADDTTLLDLSVSANGKQVLVLRQSNQNSIFLGDFDQSLPAISNIRRLTLDERINNPHAWTADNRSIIFESNRNGSFDLFKQEIGRRTPETLVSTPATEILPQLSPDGQFVLYAAHEPEAEKLWFYRPRTYKLMRVPVEGGTPAEVPIGGVLDEFRCALGSGRRCVLRTTLPEGYRVYYDLDPIKGKGRELARCKSSQEVLGDWDISPDGTHIAIPNHDPQDARIRIIALTPRPNEERERELVIKDLANVRGLVWAADGHGWFVSTTTSVANRLMYVYLDGRYRALGNIQGWAVPSPDGRRIAFIDQTIGTNAWMFER